MAANLTTTYASQILDLLGLSKFKGGQCPPCPPPDKNIPECGQLGKVTLQYKSSRGAITTKVCHLHTRPLPYTIFASGGSRGGEGLNPP